MNSKINDKKIKMDIMDPQTGEHYDVNLKVWDTAGQEIFDSITKNYYRSADAAIIVYAVDNNQSFADCNKWAKDLQSNVGPKEKGEWMQDLVTVVVANKVDLPDEDHVVEA